MEKPLVKLGKITTLQWMDLLSIIKFLEHIHTYFIVENLHLNRPQVSAMENGFQEAWSNTILKVYIKKAKPL